MRWATRQTGLSLKFQIDEWKYDRGIQESLRRTRTVLMVKSARVGHASP